MLLEFFGRECIHCMKMTSLIDKLEKEEGIKVERLETWHNKENAKKLKEYDTVACGGVPFFINTETGQTICGETDYDSLRAWALHKNEI